MRSGLLGVTAYPRGSFYLLHSTTMENGSSLRFFALSWIVVPFGNLAVAVFLFLIPALEASPEYHQVGPVVVDTSNSPSITSATDFDLGPPNAPVFLEFYSSNSNVYTLTSSLEGSLSFLGPITSAYAQNQSLVDFVSLAGSLTLEQSGDLTLNWTTGSAPTDGYRLGVGAVSATGGAKPDDIGSDVAVILGTSYAASITAGLTSPVTSLTTLELQPEGVRTAGLSGILAVSYGYQGDDKDSASSGSVTVTTGSQATIAMSGTDANVLVAGISAAGAVGPSKTRDGTTSIDRTVTVNHSGSITNTAASGIGIMATATGGQFVSGGSEAIGSPVVVDLTGGTVSATGQSGLGIFALSTAFPTNKKEEKANDMEGGTVTVSLDSASTITTGASGSDFSIGILAISAGTNALIDPFSSQSVNTFGEGDSGDVSVTSFGTINTQGAMSIGIAALSIGGAGIATNSSADLESQFSYLGAGDNDQTSSGTGGSVTVANSGAITTLGTDAYGIVATSSGGGGLINNAIEAAFHSEGEATAGLTIGNGTNNHGDPGHNAGTVTVNNDGAISTGDGTGTGAASIGIVAQSIGGNGGSAGGRASLFVGDKGGGGGDGGAVGVTTTSGSTVTTEDVNSVGILAQSIGGGGGNGGNAEGLFVAVGGRGGQGGSGNSVSATLAGEIATSGDHSGGLIAQSIGGGGGHGGGATSVGVTLDASIGGKGAQGGNAGDLSLNATASSVITTTGNNSGAILLQSVGGGGGTGGASYSGSEAFLASASMALGGGGSGGGNGGTILQSSSYAGTITTGVQPPSTNNGRPNIDGADSIGILVQSVGGGGGHGGSAVANSLALGAEEFPAVGFALTFGGSGGVGGHGGAVNFDNEGQITTWADGSHGIVAQSIGGGGGNGGDSTAATLLASANSTAASSTIAFGGSSSSGGNAGTVTLTNGETPGDTAAISTNGQNSAAIIAQSIGGGGGNGGLGTARTDTLISSGSASVNVGLGGSGSGGGNSEGVAVTNYGSLSTQGSGSQGILAQSIGGGGGNAGGGTSVSHGQTINVEVTVGASGGPGGAASTVDFVVENYGLISTKGGDATGILAQSIGGGGGNAGSSDPQAVLGSWSFLDNDNPDENAESEDPPEQISVAYVSQISIGGSGGSGGAGGVVSVSNFATNLNGEPFVTGSTARIETEGDRAFGILAQSIGGGGGTGGAATALSNSRYFQNEDENFQTTINLSGDGGSASAGGTATVSNSGEIETSGYSSHGLFAQSIGGGGGVGADGSIDAETIIGLGINVNGESGSGGNGGAVNLTQAGTVETSGHDAIGVFAQSIGGGGGVASSGTSTPFFQLGGSVSLVYQTVSVTLGFNPRNNTATNGGVVTINSGPNASLGENLAGGEVTTLGDWSHGVVGQSIGGGGGKAVTIFGTTSNFRPDLNIQLGAESGLGSGAAVTTSLSQGQNSRGIRTSGYSAHGILLQSIGAGGGLATDGSASSASQGQTIQTPTGPVTAVGSLELGGKSGASGDGGSVELAGEVVVSTSGRNAHAVVLQSIGGGGGLAGTGSSLTDPDANSAASVVIGGSGAVGNGGTVTLDNVVVDISTTQANAFGLIAQSIGGGGGIATVANSQFSTPGTNRLGGSAATTTSNGGDLELTISSGSITTSGDGAHAFVAQSIGGGGGIGNPDSSSGLTTTATANDSQALGSGGEIFANLNANITTSGDGAYGILLQTIAGGGGILGNFAGSTGSATSTSGANNGATVLTQAGSVTTSGTNSVAIFAQNKGATGAGNAVTLNINGTVSGGSGPQGAAIWVDGGGPPSNPGDQTNFVNVSSTGNVSALSGMVISYSGAEGLNVKNEGVVTGSLSLGNGGIFDNAVGGIFNSGAEVTGPGVIVANLGLMDVGGSGPAMQTSFETLSTLANYEVGTLKFDIFSDLSYDTIQVGINTVDEFTPLGIFEGTIWANFEYVPSFGEHIYTLILDGSNFYDLSGLSVTGLPAGSSWQTFVGSGGSFNLVIQAVPEPSALQFLLCAAVGLWLLRKRKRKADCGS